MRKTAVAVALGAALAMGSMGGATAAPRDTVNVSFFASSGSSSGWTTEANGNKAIALSVDATGFAGASLNRAAGAVADLSAPSFDFLANAAGPSGGSPRLVVRLSDGGRIEVRPLSWSGAWDTVDADDAGMVDTNGGACGFKYGVNWAAAQACAGSATVTSAFMVTDSGWLAGAHTTLVDNLQFDGKTFSSAADNRR